VNISKFFIDRPIFAGVLSALILLAGIVAAFHMPVSEYPQVIPPSVVVHAQYPGANARTIAETVAAPLEQSINGVEDMLYMDSKASGDGHLYLTATFKLGTDPDRAQQLVQTRVSQAQPRLRRTCSAWASRPSRTRRSSPSPCTWSRRTGPTTTTTSATTPSST
jgi:multidrug efflux pump